MHKPNKQTVLPFSAVPSLMASLPLNRLKGFGGKLGKTLTEKMNAKIVSDLLSINESVLMNEFGDQTTKWMVNVARGIDLEPVADRLLAKQIGCSKTYRGANIIPYKAFLEGHALKYLIDLSSELLERVEQDTIDNGRVPRLFQAGVTIIQRETSSSPMKVYRDSADYRGGISVSKQCGMPVGNADIVAGTCLSHFVRLAQFLFSSFCFLSLSLTYTLFPSLVNEQV